MARMDTSTKVVFGIILIAAIIGIVLVLTGKYKTPNVERPGNLVECCTCMRATVGPSGILPGTTEVLFANTFVPDCRRACAAAQEYAPKSPGVQYALRSTVNYEPDCNRVPPEDQRFSAGAGGVARQFYDQPRHALYYVTS
jgi:hypothetical protein